MYVVNRTRGTYLGVKIQVANTFFKRLLGLYAHRHLHFGDGVWLVPCTSVQTIGMRFPIDIVFLNSLRRVVRVVEQVQPGRVVGQPGNGVHSTLELPAGVVKSSETQVGDSLEFIEETEPVAQHA
ncbi:MAG: DUF192 domain-containing protein [Candidatus Methylomirabilaceae bacterium]